MNYKEIQKISDSKYSHVLSRVKREKPVLDNPLILGFDTEFTYKDETQCLISIQYAHGDGSRVYYGADLIGKTNNREPSLASISSLEKTLFEFLHGLGIEPNGTIYLVAHYVYAEMGNFEIPKTLTLKQINKGLIVEGTLENPIDGSEHKIKIIDLNILLKTSLGEIGAYHDFPKLTLNELGGQSETHWKENMDILLKEYPDIFMEYACRDAEIAYKAYTKLRDYFLVTYRVDLLHFNTLPRLSSYLFRRDYLSTPCAPTKTIEISRKQSKTLSDGEVKYYDILEKKEIFDGDLNVRNLSMLAYHGGRMEAFYRGSFKGQNLAYYDVDSLYPSSAILQPLPTSTTRWVKYSKRNHEKFLSKAEGFAEVQFRFPDDAVYPNLPVPGAREKIFYFPKDGVSHCTLSELRLAVKLGLTDFKIIKGYGFYPKRKENEHPLRDCMKVMLDHKHQHEKGSLDYSICKVLMNSLVGKFAQKYEGAKSPSEVGELWYPEWAALILGKGRAIISEFVAKGAYHVSTDSVVLPRDVDIRCKSLDELRSIGSDLRLELEVDHGVILRERGYVLNPMSTNRKEKHTARIGGCSEEEFLEKIREGFNTGQIPDLTTRNERLVKYKESLKTGKDLNSKKTLVSSINIDWDGKRKLVQEVDNPFIDSSWSMPLDENMTRNNKIRNPNTSKVGRKKGKPLDTEKKTGISKLYGEGLKQCEIANELNVSPGYVSKVVNKLMRDKEGEIHA